MLADKLTYRFRDVPTGVVPHGQNATRDLAEHFPQEDLRVVGASLRVRLGDDLAGQAISLPSARHDSGDLAFLVRVDQQVFLSYRDTRMRLVCLCLLILTLCVCSCNSCESVADGDQFALLDSVTVRDSRFDERVFRNDLYEVQERTSIPEYIGNIYQLQEGTRGIYINDPQAVYRYDAGRFETVFNPSKGEGPGEVKQVFRFDVRGDTLIAIAGYPGNRIMTHNMETDSTSIIETMYRSNVLVDREGNIYGERVNAPSNSMITKFNAKGDRLTSFGHLFSNQDMSLNMFDMYWDYNEDHDAIVMCFMYTGYYAVLNTDGSLRYVIESVRHPGEFPVLVKRGGMRFVDTQGSSILIGMTTNNDEVHIYTAKASNSKREVYGAVVDVLDIRDGSYLFSYVLNEPLHWPILLLDDGSIASVTQDYELVIWKRKAEWTS